MKKTISVFVLLVILLSLCACRTESVSITDTVVTKEPVVTDTEAQTETKTETETEKETEIETEAPDTQPYVDTDALPIENGTQFFFSSGAGAWYSSITLNSDGSFEGEYSDSEMGEMGEGYPNGTVYTSDFKGKFTNIKKTDDYSYSMTLEYIETEKPVGEEWIEDGIRFVAAEAHGITGEDFILYLPETPAVETDKDFLSWWQHRYEHLDENGELTDSTVTLGCYAIRNMTDNFGFFEY